MHLVCIPSFHNNENETSFSVEYPSSLLPNTFKIDIACVWNGSTSTPAALHLKALTWSSGIPTVRLSPNQMWIQTHA